jgi:hypothetical protein
LRLLGGGAARFVDQARGSGASSGAGAYEIAKAGGRHEGFYNEYRGRRAPELEKAIRSLRTQIDAHLDKIADPDRHIDVGVPAIQRRNLVTSYWPREIVDFQSHIAILEGILKERGK